MFASSTIALLAAASAAVWTYSKTMRRTGNNTRTSIITAVAIALIVLVVAWSALSLIDQYL